MKKQQLTSDMHLNKKEVMSLAHFIYNKAATYTFFSYRCEIEDSFDSDSIEWRASLKMAWHIYRILKDEKVSNAFWRYYQAKPGIEAYFMLLQWHAERGTDEVIDYCMKIHCDFWEVFDQYVYFNIWEDTDVEIGVPTQKTKNFVAGMQERVYSYAAILNLFSYRDNWRNAA